MYKFLHSNKSNGINKAAQIAFCRKKNMCVNGSGISFVILHLICNESTLVGGNY